MLNDRLLLGLKGSMAEFELGLLRQRAREAFEQEVRRGFTLWEVPVGFIRSEEGRIEKTPDRQVQQAISSVFQKFHQLGSARQATIWFREEQIRCRTPNRVWPERKFSGRFRQWKNPSDPEKFLLWRSICVGQDRAAYGDRRRTSPPAIPISEAAK